MLKKGEHSFHLCSPFLLRSRATAAWAAILLDTLPVAVPRAAAGTGIAARSPDRSVSWQPAAGIPDRRTGRVVDRADRARPDFVDRVDTADRARLNFAGRAADTAGMVAVVVVDFPVYR